MFCDFKPFNYILEYKGYKESNIQTDKPEIYLEKGVCDLNVLVKLFYQNFTFPQIRYIIYRILKESIVFIIYVMTKIYFTMI